jgi:hypothetical protein
MAAKTFLRRVAGRFQEIVAVVVSAGAANDGDLVALDPNGRLDASLMPSGFGADVVSAAATEAITAPALVNLYLAGGVLSVRNADQSAEGKEANGFVTASIGSGTAGQVSLSGNLTGLTGLDVGSRYFLGTVGQPTKTPATGAGKVDQFVGKAISPTTIAFRAHDYVLKAA